MTDAASEAAAVLREQLSSTNEYIVIRAAESLFRSIGEVAEDALRPLLQSPRPDISRRAAAVLLKGEKIARAPEPQLEPGMRLYVGPGGESLGEIPVAEAGATLVFTDDVETADRWRADLEAGRVPTGCA
jgi:HEAT repeat protein